MKLPILMALALFSATAMAEKDPGMCQQLRDEVKSIETQQKQALPAQTQDSLKDQKKRAQSRMHDLECKTF